MTPRVEYTEPQVTTYVCSKCGEEDHDRGVNIPAPRALVCFACGAGNGKTLEEMHRLREGMFIKARA